jgi:hypothetical protein
VSVRLRSSLPVLLIAVVLLAFSPALAAPTAQFWNELGGSGSGDGLSQEPQGIAEWLGDREVAVAIDPSGRPVVVYVNADFEVVVRRWSGSVWEALGAPFNEGVGTGVEPRVAINAAGDIFVAWLQVTSETPVNHEVYLLKWTGSAWVELGSSASDGGVTASPAPQHNPHSYSLAVDADGRPVIAFDAFTTNDVLLDAGESAVLGAQVYVKRWTGSAWQFVGSDLAGGGASNALSFTYNEQDQGGGFFLFDTAFHGAWQPSIALVPNGELVVAFVYRSFFFADEDPPEWLGNNDVYVTRWNGSAWSTVGPAVPAGSTDPGAASAVRVV